MLLPVPTVFRIVVVTLITLSANPPLLQADTPAGRLHQAYYLEHAHHNVAAAAELYQSVATDRDAPTALRDEARTRLAGCNEELATADLASLMPPDPIIYVEINRPGQRVRELIEQLGLLADDKFPHEPGQKRLAISPAVIEAFLGMRGGAIAITGVNMMSQQPTGVAVLHPGSVELVRGLIETALPAGGEPIDTIGGYPTYQVEQAYITLTHKLVIVGSMPAEIEDVIDRLNNNHADSLANNEHMRALLDERDGALAYFCINPQPLLPMINSMIGAGASSNRELALARALLDIENFAALSGRFDIGEEGLRMDLALRLQKDHRNLVYNFFRRPGIDRESLRAIPAGVAGFATLAFNEAPQDYNATIPAAAGDTQIVTSLDLGREVFANINGVALYLLPPTENAPPTEIPDVAAVITVNDPAKSQALWNQLLGLASIASGGAMSLEGQQRMITDVPVRCYAMEGHVDVLVATVGHHLYIALSEPAMRRSLEVRHDADSILDDHSFDHLVKTIGPHTTFACAAHAGRCVQVARQFASPGELRELEPFADLLTELTLAARVDHSDRELRFATAVAGLPDVGPFVAQMLNNPIHALHAIAGPSLEQQFNHAAARGDHATAHQLAKELYEERKHDAMALNNFAWALLTEERYDGAFNDIALRFARQSNDLSEHANWAYLDTLALAEFHAGNVAKAIRLEKQAIKQGSDVPGPQLDAMRQALQRFEQAGNQM